MLSTLRVEELNTIREVFHKDASTRNGQPPTPDISCGENTSVDQVTTTKVNENTVNPHI